MNTWESAGSLNIVWFSELTRFPPAVNGGDSLAELGGAVVCQVRG